MNRHLLLTALLTTLIAAPVFAGFEEGLTAYEKGDYAQAMSEWKPRAELGYRGAQYNLGIMYYNGEGVPKDFKQAVIWYRKAAEQSHAGAQFNLGVMYEHGEGVPQDYKQAIAWYRKAAEQGHASAQHNLGAMYDKGRGVPQDYKQAIAWYRKAAEQGDAKAQTNLGAMYYDGQGTSKDVIIAYMLSDLGATGGNEDASNNREHIAKEMTPRQIEEAQALTRTWKVGTPLPTKTKTGQLKEELASAEGSAPAPKKLKACNPLPQRNWHRHLDSIDSATSDSLSVLIPSGAGKDSAKTQAWQATPGAMRAAAPRGHRPPRQPPVYPADPHRAGLSLGGNLRQAAYPPGATAPQAERAGANLQQPDPAGGSPQDCCPHSKRLTFHANTQME